MILPQQFDQPSFGLNRELLVKGWDESTVKAYYNYMVDLAVILGAKKPRAETELKDALNFEIALAEVDIIFDYCKLII